MAKYRPDPKQQPKLISEERGAYQLTPEEQAEKAQYRQRLAAFLADPDSRQIEGFPLGSDEDILALSDPPYYTACPNPFLAEILQQWQAERPEAGIPYHREPFAADVSEGKNDPIYNAHSYHTKVPHKAIMRYILHYTDPGDIIFDGFCGTGMTGVAAQLCGDRRVVESLGYRVDENEVIYDGSRAVSRLGARRAVLVDLSPAATFIAYNYNTPVDVAAFEAEAHHILEEVEQECGWMYETWHPHCDDQNRVKGQIHVTLWSDVFVCSQCGSEMIFWDVAVDIPKSTIRDDWLCPSCSAKLGKNSNQKSGALRAEHAWETLYDRALHQTVHRVKQAPVLINYSVGKKRHEKRPDAEDLALIQKTEDGEIPHPYPTERMPEGGESRRNDDIGMTNVHHFYTRRNLWVLSSVFQRLRSTRLEFIFTSLLMKSSKMCGPLMSNYFAAANGKIRGGWVGKNMSGTLYIPSIMSEASVFKQVESRIRSVLQGIPQANGRIVISTASSTNQPIPTNSVDYIFVDPPFGSNLMYSELSFIWESWLKVFTNNQAEAIISNEQRKKLYDYQLLMENCFHEFLRILKPGRWITIEFHNSQNAVWNAIQEALLRVGFMVADVRTLDKQQGSYKQYTSTSAVKQDLVISAYKPNDRLEERFRLQAGSPDGAWAFVRYHLSQLPVVVEEKGELEVVAERQAYLLFDRMVAFHIQRGASVPLSASEFYVGLKQRFVERDGMYFLPDQVPAYDGARLRAGQPAQLTLFVS
ncbi:MAG: hypothetical protein JXB15_02145, partial [Anaerolineales bacterium]|nr:hypothetical protein [Anaerolineales bacterium]